MTERSRQPGSPGSAQLRKSIGFAAGWVTRHINSTRKLLPSFQDSTSSHNVEALVSNRDKLTKQKARVDELYDTLFETLATSEEDATEDMNALDALTGRVDDTMAEIAQALNRVNGCPRSEPQAASSAAQGRQQARAKPNEALRPFKLTKDHTPVELASWIAKFKAYFSNSNFAVCTVAEQQAYFKNVIDVNLETRIADRVMQDTPVFSDRANIPSCMSILEEEFDSRYPLFTRRFNLFNHKQGEGQLFSDFAADVRAQADRARLHDLTPNDLVMLIYITGCRDAKLRDKLLKEREPTLTIFHELIRQHEAANFAIKTMAGINPNLSNKEEVRVARRQTNHPTIEQLKASRRCVRCGNGNHESRDCQHINSTCNGCGVKGHLQRVCQKQFKTERKLATRKANDQQRSRQIEEEVSCESPPPGYDSGSEAEGGQMEAAAKVVRTEYARTIPTMSGKDPRIRLQFHHQRGTFKFEAVADSGTTRTIISHDIAKKYNVKMYKSNSQLRNASNEPMKCEGRTPVKINGVPTMALVSSSLKNDILLSLRDMKKLGIVSKDFPCLPIRFTNCDEEFEEVIKRTCDEYRDVISDILKDKPMTGVDMKIHLQEGALPTKITAARKVPIHWQEQAKSAVDKLIMQDVLQVETEPTEWIAPGFFVPKGSPEEKEAIRKGLTVITVKDLRLVVDYTGLNKYVNRPHWPFPSCQEVMDQISPHAKFFATLDCTAGYHQIQMDRKSQKLTTFLLPCGRFSFKRAPMGLNASSDEWCRRSDEALKGTEGTIKLVDDILIHAQTLPILISRIKKVLDKCREHNLTISRKKFKVGNRVKFAGFIVSDKGVAPDPERIAAIAGFPVPKSVSDVRSFLGLANQLGSFLPDLAQVTDDLRKLLKKNIAFQWLETHQQAFDKAKEILTSPKIVQVFDTGKATELMTDASKLKGLGFALMQTDDLGQRRLVTCGSRSLRPFEKNYAIVELESKAIEWAINKCRHYLLGITQFKVITDHKPLVSLYSKPLDDIPNARVQRHRETLARFSFNVQWEAGKRHLIADALSRNPVFEAREEPCGDECIRVASCIDPNLQELQKAAETDGAYRCVLDILTSGVDINTVHRDHPAKLFSNIWHDLSVDNGLIIKDGCKIVVPRSCRKRILQLAHGSHSGISKTRALLNEIYYWPGMNSDAKNMVESCPECQKFMPSLPKQPWMETTCDTPMQQVGVDLFEFGGVMYVAMMGRYTGFLFFESLRSCITAEVLKQLEKWFYDWGWPQVIRSDGGPQFRGEFKQFCESHSIKHEVSSPYYPQSNGLSEMGVKMAKTLLRKVGTGKVNIAHALQEWRNTPRAEGYSPAHLMFQRRQRTSLPCHPSAYQQIKVEEAIEARAKARGRAKSAFDEHASQLRDLHEGERVVVQDPKTKRWELHGSISKVLHNGRSYEVLLDDDYSIRTNRRRVRPTSTIST